MNGLIKNDRLKIQIMKILYDEGQMTPSMLSAKLNYKHETVKKSLLFFEKIGLVRKQITKHGQKNYEHYELTSLGKNLWKKTKLPKKNF